MTKEKLEALNKQRALKRKKYTKPTKQGWNGVKISLCFNALLLIPLEAGHNQILSWIDALNKTKSKGVIFPAPAVGRTQAIWRTYPRGEHSLNPLHSE